jgi:hypothetical protein
VTLRPNRAPIHWIGILLLSLELAGCAVPTVPRSVSVDQIPAAIRALSDYASFSPSGAAFFKDKLYVSTNIGLLVVNGVTVETLYKWLPRDDVVAGPWFDVVNDALWIHHAHDNYLRRFDGTSWRLVTPPVYRPSGSITIVRGISSPTAFWLLVGGHVWRYRGGEISWILEPRPPAPKYSETEAIAPLGASMLYIVREGLEGTWHSRYAVYDRENNWARQNLSDKRQFPYEFGGAVTTPDGSYIRARDGRLFLIGTNNVQTLETPGRCEAIAQTSMGKLLASFVQRGIFLLDNGGWQLKAAYPYGPQEGEHWAFLAESNGQIAYATTSVRESQGGRTIYSRPAALWVLRAGKLERLILN